MTKKKNPQPPTEDDIDMLVCARTGIGTGSIGGDVLPGSVWDKCRECGASVWISLSGQQAMKRSTKLAPFCMECASLKHKDVADLKVQIAPGSLRELKRYLAQRKQH